MGIQRITESPNHRFPLPLVRKQKADQYLKNILQKILLNSWTISIVLGLTVFILIPFHPDPYKIISSLEDQIDTNYQHLQYADLDDDNDEEIILTELHLENRMISHVVSRMNRAIIDQYNVEDVDQVLSTKCYIGDYNSDGYAELYTPFLRGNDILLKVFSPLDPDSEVHEKEIHICTIAQIGNTSLDVETRAYELFDINGNGTKEFFLILYGRYDYCNNRRLIQVNLETDSINMSASYGNNLSTIVFFDHEQDGKFEITGIVGSASNQDSQESTLFSDDTAWLMVYDENLELYKHPKGFAGPFATVIPLPVLRGGKTELIAYVHHSGDTGSKSSIFETVNLHSIAIKDTIGNRIKSQGERMERMISGKDTSYIMLTQAGLIIFYDHNLEYRKTVDINTNINGYNCQLDITSNGHREILLSEKFTNDILVLNGKGRLLCRHKFDDTEYGLVLGGLLSHYGQTKAWLRKGNRIYFYTMHRNYLYGFSWLVLLGLIGLFYILALTFKWIQRRQTREKEKISKQINALQLQSLKNQLDPHFTFNALNVLTYLSGQEDNKGVESFTHHFSKLLRSQLEMSDQPSVKLHVELQFVRHYIELQKLRFDVPITYEEEIGFDVDMDLRIPRMMIHTHVENAIKHGLIPAGGGEVRIDISRENQSSVIQIQDNGVGRKEKPKSDSSTFRPSVSSSGKGLTILIQLYDLYFKLYKVKILQEFVDLKDENGKSKGTIVKIKL